LVLKTTFSFGAGKTGPICTNLHFLPLKQRKNPINDSEFFWNQQIREEGNRCEVGNAFRVGRSKLRRLRSRRRVGESGVGGPRGGALSVINGSRILILVKLAL
jgi:hypothetical protein